MIGPAAVAAGAGLAAIATASRLRSGKKRNRAQVRNIGVPGAPPTLLHAPDHATDTRIEIIRYNHDTFEVISESTLDDIAAHVADESHVSWIHVSGLADTAAIQALGERFGFHRLLIEDIVSVGQRPKAEHYGDLLFLILRLAPYHHGDELDQCSLVLLGNSLFSFDEHHGDCFNIVRDRLRAGGQLRNLQANHLMLALMDAAVDAYFPVLESEGTLLDMLEDRVLEPRSTAVFAETTEVKRRLLSYRRALWPTRELVGSLLRDNDARIAEDSRPYLRDIHDHAVELVDLVEMFRETATSISELHLAMVSARLNDVMRFLTIISTVFMPLSFIVGLYGMNFEHMPELHWRYGYPAVLLLMAAIAIGFLLFFWRKGMLGAPGEDPALAIRRASEESAKSRQG